MAALKKLVMKIRISKIEENCLGAEQIPPS